MELLKLIFYKIYCWQRRFGGGIFDTIIGLSASLSVLMFTLAILMEYLIGRENLSSINDDTLFFLCWHSMFLYQLYCLVYYCQTEDII